MKQAGLGIFVALFCAFGLIVGCGGDGSLDQQDQSVRPELWQPGGDDNSDGGGSDTAAASHSLQLTMWNCPDPYADSLADCTQSSSFDAQKAAVLKVSALRDGAATQGEMVTVFTDKGSLIPADGRVLTDSEGNALLRLQAEGDEGVVAISATFADAASQMYAEINAIQVGLQLSTSLADGQVLSDGSTMAVTAALTVNGQPYLEPLPVTFSSTCALGGEAEIDDQVLSQDGEAVATYRSTGCEQQDQITATLALGSSTATDSVTVALASVPIASIQYLAATPDYLQLEGAGGSRTATLEFQVLDQNGQPKQGVDIAFALASGEDKVSLNAFEARSNNEGKVAVILTSKNLPGSVRVKAEVMGSDPLIAAVSQELTIGTGLADRNSFDISFSVLNPQAWRYNGVRVGINLYAADHFNNPVPDGTAISVITEGGAVSANCVTEGGICNVDWISQDPRPDNGRVTVMAFIEGEESFNDINGNGFYEPDAGTPPQDEWDAIDVHEAYLDLNEDGLYDEEEQFIDRNQDGQWTDGDGHYNGLLCQGAALADGDCSRELVDVSTSGVIVMSGANPIAFLCHYDDIDADGDGRNWFDCWNDTSDERWQSSGLSGVTMAYACVMDQALDGTLNPVPYDSRVTFSTTASSDLKIVGRSSFSQRSTSSAIYHVNNEGSLLADWRSSCGVGAYAVGLDTSDGGGTLFLEATLPDGLFVSDSVVVTP